MPTPLRRGRAAVHFGEGPRRAGEREAIERDERETRVADEPFDRAVEAAAAGENPLQRGETVLAPRYPRVSAAPVLQKDVSASRPDHAPQFGERRRRGRPASRA